MSSRATQSNQEKHEEKAVSKVKNINAVLFVKGNIIVASPDLNPRTVSALTLLDGKVFKSMCDCAREKENL